MDALNLADGREERSTSIAEMPESMSTGSISKTYLNENCTQVGVVGLMIELDENELGMLIEALKGQLREYESEVDALYSMDEYLELLHKIKEL
jgi:hypothetical protein